MAAVGFKVYAFHAVKRKGRSPEDLGVAGGTHAATVADVLEANREVLLSGRPDYFDLRGEVPDADEGDFELRINSVSRVGRSVHCEVSYGKVGGHDDLLQRDGSATSIARDSAARRYRVDFYFPETGSEGIIVAEVRGRTTPISDLLAWLRRFEALLFPDDADPDEYWRSIRTSTIADVGHLMQLIQNARSTTVQLTSVGPPTSRGRRATRRGELEVVDITAAQAADLVAEVTNWVKGKKKGAVARTASKVGIDLKKIKAGGLDVNRTTIRLEGDQPLSVSPDNVDDVFTYPLTKDLRPDYQTWIYGTVPKARELAGQEILDINFE